MKTRNVSLVLFTLFFCFLGCRKKHHDDPGLEAPNIRINISETLPFSIIEIKVLNADPESSYDVEFDLGNGVIIRLAAEFRVSSGIIETTAPLGIIDRNSVFSPGNISLRAVRLLDDRESRSSWVSIEVLPTTENVWGFGTVSRSAGEGMLMTALDAMADFELIQSSTNRDLAIEKILRSVTHNIAKAGILAEIVANAERGQSTDLGRFNGVELRYTDHSLAITDNLILALNDALASAFGSAPPDPQSFGEFYNVLGHDFPEFAKQYIAICSGAMISVAETLKTVIQKEDFLGGSRLGALAFSVVALNGFFGSIANDMLGGQTANGEAAFFDVHPEIAGAGLTALEIAREHFSGGDLERLYGSALLSVGRAFTDGIQENLDFGWVLSQSYEMGFLPPFGLTSSGFGINILITQMTDSYEVTAITAPTVMGSPLRLYSVSSATGEITVLNGLTGDGGILVFPKLGVKPEGTLDAIQVINPGGDARALGIVFF